MFELPVSELDEAAGQVSPHWEALRGGHVLLTGGTGFIGLWLLETFLRANAVQNLRARAAVLTRDPERFRAKAPHVAGHPCIRLLQGDVHSPEFPPEGFSHAIHAAADAGRSSLGHDPLLTFDTIVTGTRRVLDFCQASGIPKLLFLSSGAVYGPQPESVEAVSERCSSAPRTDDPSSAYAEGKRAAEFLCAAFAARGGLQVSIARCFSFIGPHLPLDGLFAAGNFIRDATAGRPIEVRSDGRAVRSYLYAADLAGWLWTMLLSPRSSGIYNVGSDRPVTIAQLAEMVAAAARVPVLFAESGPTAPSRYVPCIERARTELGLTVSVPLEEAIRRTLHWHSQDL